MYKVSQGSRPQDVQSRLEKSKLTMNFVISFRASTFDKSKHQRMEQTSPGSDSKGLLLSCDMLDNLYVPSFVSNLDQINSRR